MTLRVSTARQPNLSKRVSSTTAQGQALQTVHRQGYLSLVNSREILVSDPYKTKSRSH